MLVQLITDAPTPTTLTLVNTGTTTGYELLSGTDWGNAVWEHQYSGARATQGARPSQGVPQNRPLVMPIRVTGTSMDNLAAKITALSAVADELRRFGGRVKWRATGETYAQYFVVMTGSSGVQEWGTRAETIYRAVMFFQAVCAPYLVGDPMDVTDAFSTDSTGDYTFDSGAAGNVAVSGGQLTAVANLSTENRAIRTVAGYTVLDDCATLKATPGATTTNFKAGVVLRRSASDTYVEAYLDDTGGAVRLRIDVVIGGARTNRASIGGGGAGLIISSGTPFWVRGRIEGNVVYAEFFTSDPTPTGSPTTQSPSGGAGYTLTSSEQTSLVAGQSGWVWTPQHASAVLDDYRREPFTYRARTLPETFHLNGVIPGDAPALADITLTHSGGSAAPVFATVGWTPRPVVHNLVWNGAFEDSAIGTNGWTGAAGSGTFPAGSFFLSGTTTLSRVTTASKYGSASLQGVTPATSSAGVSFGILRQFKKGVTYAFSMWVRAASSTTAMEAFLCSLNFDGSDASAAAAVTLSTTWTQVTGTWVPTADRAAAEVVFRTSAATATTFTIDGVQVYESTTAPTLGDHSYGAGAYPPFGVLEAEACDTTDLSNWAITASGSYRLGYYLTHATATTATAGWWIDPNVLVPDDYTLGELSVEVWARVLIDGAATSPKYTLSVRPEAGTSFGTERFTLEYGSAGKLVTAPSSGTAVRFVRLGTLPLLVDRVSPRRWKLWLAYSHTGSASSGVDYLVLVPSQSRALSPTGKVNDSTYPRFVGSTGETSRTIRSDLSGRTAKPPANPHPDTGLGGELLELPFGQVDALVKLSSLVPDDPTSDTSTEQLAHTATLHAAITPRWAMLRGAS